MMKKITERSIATFTFIFIWFTVLFDPSNLALGTKLISLPDFILGLAEIFGNLVWLLGFTFFIVGILLIITFFIEDEMKKMINEGLNKIPKEDIREGGPFIINDKFNKPMFKRFKWWHKILLPLNIVGSLIAIGSGFWFTGTGWLLIIISTYTYRKVSLELAEDLIKEKLEKDDE